MEKQRVPLELSNGVSFQNYLILEPMRHSMEKEDDFFEKFRIIELTKQRRNYFDPEFVGISKIRKRETLEMKDFTTYLSTAPVLTLVSLTVVAGLLIEINRFFPDALIAAF